MCFSVLALAAVAQSFDVRSHNMLCQMHCSADWQTQLVFDNLHADLINDSYCHMV